MGRHNIIPVRHDVVMVHIAHNCMYVQVCTMMYVRQEIQIEIDSSIWREEIQNRNRLLARFGGKKFKIEILDLAGRNSK
jgi:hypothetical protein